MRPRISGATSSCSIVVIIVLNTSAATPVKNRMPIATGNERLKENATSARLSNIIPANIARPL